MSGALVQNRTWSRTQWGGALLVIMAIHLIVITALSKRRPITPPSPPRLSKTYFVGEPNPASRLAGLLSLQDPLVFAEMDLRRISRMSLMATPRFSYELTNWTEPYRWLAPS